ncbi:MAG TPA: MFS transporter [Anaerovoracaceae bacterium]|nr:MFS transporter [Anaerovoracaceae bacterium]
MSKVISPAKLKVALLAIALQDAAAGASSPALASIIASFPSFAPSTVMLIASVPALVQGIVALCYGKLSGMFRKRPLLFFGLACFIIGGAGPFFLNNLYAILAMRALVGVGAGICFPMSLNLIADFFEGSEKDNLMGYSSAVGGLSGVIFQSLGGILTATFGWHYCFLTYLLVILIVIIAYVWLPEPERKQVSGENLNAPKAQVKLPASIFILSFFALVWTMLNFVLITNSAIYIEAAGFGNAAAAGTVLSAMTAGALCGGVVFGRIKKVIGSYVIPLLFFWSCASFILIYYAPNLMAVIVGGAIAGLSLGSQIPAFAAMVTDLTDQASHAWAIGIFFVANCVAQFIQAPVYDIAINGLGVDYGRDLFGVSAVGFIAAGVIVLIWTIFMRKSLKPGKTEAGQ